ncbi:glutaredoxin-like protein NrdH [Rothia koreensis]|uniref:glutaredoxin-like protein NrdH n=1 Tax=Rothia koreensis TaxID=592378 RepID=UPI0037C8920C
MNQQKITVYSTPQCPQCMMTKKSLDRAGITYDEVDLATDAAALDHVKALGYTQAPVVVAGDDHWSGFRPDKIEALIPAAH